jgi:methylenetetrahydrofolate reductase (NADPH)
MHIRDILAKRRPTFSFEFFPPKTAAGAEDLYRTIVELEAFDPSFVSVTYGAGGSTRELTHDLVLRIKQTTGIPPIPHLTCVGHSEADISEILRRYAEAGVCNILALRGDPPRDWPDYDWSDCDFNHARDLVAFIRRFNESGAHPDRLLELDHLKAKIDAGADYICTQLFFDNHDFFDFRDRCRLRGIDVPIIAGIMPVTSLSSMSRMADLAAGARFPAKLLRALDRAKGDAAAVEKVGIHYAAQQCAELLDHGVDGIHFYTLNKSKATREIYSSLGLATAG